MTRYSPEPPRRDCIVHHTFDTVDGDRVVDTSPQESDGTIVGDVTLGHPGVVGQSARLRNESADIEINGADEFFPMSGLTITSWGSSQYAVPASEKNVTAEITVEGTTFQLEHDAPEEVDDWQFAALTYGNGGVARLHYGTLDRRPFVADEVRIGGGDVTDAHVEINAAGWGYVDDTRMYRTSLGGSGVENVHSIGYEHQSIELFGDHWNNEGIPYRAENRDFAGTLGESKDEVFRQLDYIRDARHIDYAAGRQLDDIGRVAGVRRREDEGDDLFRARIVGTFIAGRSGGTTDDVIEAAAAILDTDPTNIGLDTDYDANPGAVFVSVRNEDIDDTELSADDLADILGDTVLGGHRVEVSRQQANPFTVRSDVQTNDPALGLTSDSISTGGTLTEDI